MNCFTISNRKIRAGIEAVENGVILGDWFRRGDLIQLIAFDRDQLPTTEKGQVNFAGHVRVNGRTILTTTIPSNSAMVRIEASEILTNLKARVIARTTCYGRRGTHRPPQCDTLVWLEDGGEVIVSFGSWKHRMVLTNCQGKLALK